jgi:hypothetical protein
MVDVTAPEPVYGLPVISHAEKILVAQEKPGDLLLDVVGVLIFVDQDELEKVAVVVPDVRMVPQNVPGQEEDVVKVQGVSQLELILVPFIDDTCHSAGQLGKVVDV